MSRQITITLSKAAYDQAALWAQGSGEPLAGFLSRVLEEALLSLPINEACLAASSDATVPLMSEAAEGRLNELLDGQLEGMLTVPQRVELSLLMLVYREGLLRKADGRAEAVHRTWRAPFES